MTGMGGERIPVASAPSAFQLTLGLLVMACSDGGGRNVGTTTAIAEVLLHLPVPVE